MVALLPRGAALPLRLLADVLPRPAPPGPDAHALCARCGTRRQLACLEAGACQDGWCEALPGLVVRLGRHHARRWLRRYPLQGLQDDIAQEAALAAWLARGHYEEGRTSFERFAYWRMRTAVRGFLELRAGHLSRRQPGGRTRPVPTLPLPESARGPEETDTPTLVAEALSGLKASHLEVGRSDRTAAVLAALQAGATFAAAGALVGVSRQRAHQLWTAAGRVPLPGR